MAAPFLIIDGYNLMHAAGIARRRYGPGMLEQCRGRLNRLVVSLLAPKALQRATIVYDAFESPTDDHRVQNFDGLRIVFAPKGSDADSEIERMLRRHSAPKQVVVVSGDHRLHKAAARRKATCVDSEDFLAALEHDAPGLGSPRRGQRPRAETFPTEAPHAEQPPESAKPIDPSTHFDSDYLNEIEEEFL